MKGFGEKCEKPPFLGILAKNDQSWIVFGLNGQNGNFFKKAVGRFLSRLEALTNFKVSEKIMNGFRETALRMNGWTNGRMDRRDSLGLQRIHRKTKNHIHFSWLFLVTLIFLN